MVRHFALGYGFHMFQNLLKNLCSHSDNVQLAVLTDKKILQLSPWTASTVKSVLATSCPAIIQLEAPTLNR